ncbi:putative Mitochondrial carrier protein [Trypanosoma vivax]|uniref:Mitochondrial carrier protein n=1 Tax=Trypanosoma vivax (strain Y486) TaxID=1055687 RepID=G0TY24_TRYVY|nr:hypothetical protein TRVL_01668 [Trypanosoma vivax]KAH8618615.1 putative Mitochondrial carrier protein [Trypanosoma vivax]CCC48869.1 conserved hypothetical protein [Trypanosoma vivax Y486]
MELNQKANQDDFWHTAGPALLSGAAQSILFNPFDRALYVRVKFRRHRFLDWRNFERPFQGFMNAAVYRTLVGASYLFWQDSVRIFIERFAPVHIQSSHSPNLNAFLIGAIAGTMNGSVLNGMQVVKYRMWGIEGKPSFISITLNMLKESGPSIFFRGIGATALRDCVFGVVYEMCRRCVPLQEFFSSLVEGVHSVGQLALGVGSQPTFAGWGPSAAFVSAQCASCQEEDAGQPPLKASSGSNCSRNIFIPNLFAAMLASVLSSPFNYVRTIIYGVPPGSVPMGYLKLLQFFCLQAMYVYRCGENYTVTGTPFLGNTTKTSYQIGSFSASRGGDCESVLVDTDRRVIHRIRQRLGARAVQRGRHPMAALRWVNSRLNIGWGSIRVGLGMAISQSVFLKLQDYAKTM